MLTALIPSSCQFNLEGTMFSNVFADADGSPFVNSDRKSIQSVIWPVVHTPGRRTPSVGKAESHAIDCCRYSAKCPTLWDAFLIFGASNIHNGQDPRLAEEHLAARLESFLLERSGSQGLLIFFAQVDANVCFFNALVLHAQDMWGAHYLVGRARQVGKLGNHSWWMWDCKMIYE